MQVVGKLLKFIAGGWTYFLLLTRLSAQSTNGASDSHLLRDVKQVSEGLVQAMNNADVAAALQLLHTNCILTWGNAEVSRGHEGLRGFHDRLMGGPDKRVESFNCEITVDDSPNLLADGATAICSGAFNEHFKLPGGRATDLQGRWSATLTKVAGRWRIANLQLSTNPFDNSLLRLAKQAGWVVGVVSLVIGGLIGWLIGRRKNVPAPVP